MTAIVRVVVVDDEPPILRSLARLPAEESYEPVRAGTAVEALANDSTRKLFPGLMHDAEGCAEATAPLLEWSREALVEGDGLVVDGVHSGRCGSGSWCLANAGW